MNTLHAPRLIIRPFSPNDLDAIYHILDEVDPTVGLGLDLDQILEERDTWLRWTILSYDQIARLHQPPYGDRAVVLRETGELIGACGYVPCLDQFEQVPGLSPRPPAGPVPFTTPEVGLYYAIAADHRRRGYAAEAARALIDHGFQVLRLKRIIATTTRDNAASIAVMRKLGMRVEANPFDEPPWLQIVGVKENPALPGS